MRVLLLSATYLECRDCFEWLDHNPGLPVHRLVSGIGQMPAALALQKEILRDRPDLILQAGIAGAASTDDLGKVFCIDSEGLADLGADEPAGFQSLFELKLADPEQAPFQSGRLVNPYRKLLDWTTLPARPGLTVNHISTDRQLLETRKQNHPLFVESMEGAALHYVALTEQTPFLQIRAVSNEAGDRDKSRWLMKEAVGALNITVRKLIEKLITSDETYFRL